MIRMCWSKSTASPADQGVSLQANVENTGKWNSYHPDGHVEEYREYKLYQRLIIPYLDGKDFDGSFAVIDEMIEKFPFARKEPEQARNSIRRQLLVLIGWRRRR